MSFYERLSCLLKLKGISHAQMINDLKLGKNAMFHWRHRNNIPSGEILLKLSEYLCVSIDYLVCNDKYYISIEESIFLKEYRKLNPEQRENVLNIIKTTLK